PPRTLPSFPTRRSSDLDVVEPRLQQAEQVEAGDAGHLRGSVEVEPELALEQEVDAACALLGAQLDPVVGHLAAANLGVHAGRHGDRKSTRLNSSHVSIS